MESRKFIGGTVIPRVADRFDQVAKDEGVSKSHLLTSIIDLVLSDKTLTEAALDKQRELYGVAE